VGANGNTTVTLTDTGTAGMTKTNFTGGSGGMSLVVPNTIGSGINNTMLYIKGYE
jgi:hypothetical protein